MKPEPSTVRSSPGSPLTAAAGFREETVGFRKVVRLVTFFTAPLCSTT